MFYNSFVKSTIFVKDPVMTSRDDPYGPMKLIEDIISNYSTVLDVGCNSGLLALHLRHKKCLVDGVDINQKALKIAKTRCRFVYRRDLYKSKLSLGNKKYDYIVFSDILEHLPNPDMLLEDAKKYLKADGKVLISLPNVARLELRISHLLGQFNYSPGILSYDHIRFFTYDTAYKMITSLGYNVLETKYTGLGQRLKILPKLFSFQFVFVCVL